jgi:hypothetical protein
MSPYKKKSKRYEPCWDIEGSDLWNFDKTMCGFLADGLERYAEGTSGHPADSDEEQWYADIRRCAAVFRRYYEDGDSYLYGTVEYDDEVKWAFRWLRKNFQGLWT